MEVILTQKINRLGEIGETVKVKDGYARNYLIPNQFALRATKQNKAYFEERRKDLEAQNAEKEKNANEIASKISNKMVNIIAQASDDGILYGSIRGQDIVSKLNPQENVNISRNSVIIRESIKTLGIYDVDISLYGSVSAVIHVNIARSESEASDAKKQWLAGDKDSKSEKGDDGANTAASANNEVKTTETTEKDQETEESK